MAIKLSDLQTNKRVKLSDLGQEEPEKPKLTWDESPIAVEPKKRRSFIRGEPVEVFDNQREISLGEKGLLPDNPGEGALSLKDYQDISYYSAGPEYARNYVGKKVKEKYGSEFSPEELTRIKDGKIQYLDLSLEKPRWREVDTGLIYSFGKPAFWGEAAGDIGAGTAGVIGGTVLGAGTPLGGIAGGAFGAGANAFFWRRKALKDGQALGMNDILTDEDINRMAAGYAMQTGGMAMGGAALGFLGAGPGEKSLFGRQAGGYVDDFARNFDESTKVVDEVNAMRPPNADEAFDPTPAQRGNVKEIKNIEATLEAGHAAKSTQEIATEISDRRAKNERVLSGIWDYIFPNRVTDLGTLEDAGLGIRASAYEAVGKSPEAQATRAAISARKKVQTSVDSIEDVLDYDKVMEQIRGVESPNGHISGTKFYELRDNLVARQAEVAQDVARRGANATVEISEKNTLLTDLMRLRGELGTGLESLRKALGDESTITQLDELIRVANANGGQIPFKMADDIHQQLGRLITKINKVGPAGGVDVQGTAPLANMLATLEQGIRQAKTGPVYARDLVEAWDARKALTTMRHDLFDSRAVREMLSSADIEGPAGIEIANRIFADKNPKYLQQLMELTKGDPESMEGLRKLFMAQYKQSVQTKNGVSLINHNKFINDHAAHIELLFPDQANRPWRAIGQLEEAAAAAEARAKQLNKIHRRAWYNAFGPNSHYSSKEMVTKLTQGRLPPDKTEELIRHLGKTDPDLLKFVQQEALASLRTKLGPSKLPTADSITKFLNSRQGINFFTLMGDQGQAYRNSLKTLADAIVILSVDQGVSKGVPSANLLTSTTRAAFGPLHRIQRFITAGRQVQGWMNAKKTYEVMSDPVRLQRALQYAATAPHMRAVPPAILADIGALAVLFNEQGGED